LQFAGEKTRLTESRVFVIIPAFNEAGRVGNVIEAIPPHLVDEIIVVDDHSTDTTVNESARSGATRIIPCQSHGVGAAIKAGYNDGLRTGGEILVVLAGDAQHDPREMNKLVRPIIEGTADYVVGDRLSNCTIGNGMSPLRFVGNRLLTIITRLITGINVKDSQCGYTAITSSALRKMALERVTDAWGVPNDLLIECVCCGLRVKYVQVSARAGLRHSYIKLRSYLPRMAFILARGTVRVLRAKVSTEWQDPVAGT
jgi:glycosyltransferase involved in cell wall biosynthesis